MNELKLYKLLETEDNECGIALADEIRWDNDEELLIWVSYSWIDDLIKGLVDIFGNGIFDDGSFDGNFQDGCICIDLNKALEGYNIDLEQVFPKDKYKI